MNKGVFNAGTPHLKLRLFIQWVLPLIGVWPISTIIATAHIPKEEGYRLLHTLYGEMLTAWMGAHGVETLVAMSTIFALGILAPAINALMLGRKQPGAEAMLGLMVVQIIQGLLLACTVVHSIAPDAVKNYTPWMSVVMLGLLILAVFITRYITRPYFSSAATA